MTKLLEWGSASLAARELRPAPPSSSTAERGLLSQEKVRDMTLPMLEGPIAIRVIGPEPNWLYPVLNIFQQLGQLHVNWDTYGGRRIDPEAVVEALQFLGQLFPGDGPVPVIVPTSSGGVQLEWYGDDFDLEVEFAARGGASVFIVNHATGGQQEFDPLTPELVADLQAKLSA